MKLICVVWGTRIGNNNKGDRNKKTNVILVIHIK